MHERIYADIDMGPGPSNFSDLSKMYTPDEILRMVEQLKLYESGSHPNQTLPHQGNNNTVDYGNRTVLSILPNTID